MRLPAVLEFASIAHRGSLSFVSHYKSRAEARTYTEHMSTIDIAKLTPAERLDLLEQLWDSLSPEAIPMTDAQKEELDRRLDELDRDGPAGIPWNEVLDRIRNRTL
jgi:putative addiction module component (TIGR02574 family)